MDNKGWIGVDLDGTLAEYHGWKGPEHIGAPVPAMVARVKRWLAEGKTVKIMTARGSKGGTVNDVVDSLLSSSAIKKWCERHLGQQLEITCSKDFDMIELWDDRAIGVIKNTGRRADGQE